MTSTSDHTPISLEANYVNGGLTPFKFEEMWFLSPDFFGVGGE